MNFKALSLLAISILLASGCSSDGDSTDTGTVSVGITDAAVKNASQVYLAITGVTFKGPDGETFFDVIPENEEYLQVPLLDLAGSASQTLVTDVEMTAGKYQWVRLEVVTEGEMDTYLLLNGDDTPHELTIPSSAQSGLKLNRGFTLPANGSADFTLDVDLQKSLVEDNNGFKLKPVIRMVDNVEAGHIAGTVDGTTLSANNCASAKVYLFTDQDAAPVDINGDSGPELVADVDETNNYSFGFVVAGDYTVSLACFAENDPGDDPEADDTLDFLTSRNVTVIAKKTETADLPEV